MLSRQAILTLFLFSGFCSGFASEATAQVNWERFRGPNGQGISADYQFKPEWTSQQFRWKTSLSGAGVSSPVIYGGVVYTTSAKADGTRVLEAHRLADGNALWSYERKLGQIALHAKNHSASSTPTADGERVYAQFYDQNHLIVVACDLKGNLVWERDFGAIEIQHGPGASMIVYEDLLIVPMEMDTPSLMFGLDKKTGKTVWQVARESDRATYATPCVLKNGDRDELVCPANAIGISGLDPKTGKMLWSTSSGLSERIVASPVLTGSMILTQCGSGGNGKTLLGIGHQPGMKVGAVKPVMTLNKNLPYVVTPVAYDGILYLWCDRGVVRGLDLTNGEELWTGRVSGNFSASPVVVGDKLYGVSEDGQLVCLALGREFQVLGRTELGEGSCATPAIASGKMVIRTESHLIAVDAE
ncbi:PQQ-binding-like beta-propeller repeat protein [Lacunimicrobium album]